jgi:peptide/nickel transport system permease protein
MTESIQRDPIPITAQPVARGIGQAAQTANNPLARAVRGVTLFVRRHRWGALGGLIVLTFLLVGLAAPVLMPHDPNQVNVRAALQGPSLTHPLGTDNLGRDLMSRVIFGARVSLFVSLTAVLAGGAVGTLLGILAGYYRRAEGWIMRLMDVMLSFPGVIVALTIIAILGPSLNNVILAIAIYQIPLYARLAHGLTLSVKNQPFVKAGQSIGLTDRRLLWRYILPNCVSPLIVQTSLLIPAAIMTAATLSFLGLGVPPPTAEWGSMLQNSLQWARTAPHIMVIPGLALMLVVLGFNILGDGLRDALDPRLTRRAR